MPASIPRQKLAYEVMNYSIVEAFKGINFIPPCVKISKAAEKDTMGPCKQTQQTPRDLTFFFLLSK